MGILESIKENRRTLGILVDPEKLDVDGFSAFAKAIQLSASKLTKNLELDRIILLIGGSTAENIEIDGWLRQFKEHVGFEILLFPGSASQISEQADGLLFLNLISGRNPEYLIGQQVKAAHSLKQTRLEIIPTAYILIDGGTETAVERVSQTQPMDQSNPELIAVTALAGQLMGNKMIYLEAGSGALNPVGLEVLKKVFNTVEVPTIIGGGLRTQAEINHRFDAGAKMVVVGTAIEDDLNWKG